MVIGVGALGNEVLKNLALFGVGSIVLVDFDTIEQSNLTRSILFRREDADKGYYKVEVAARRIREINPDIQILPVCGDLLTDTGLGFYRRMDVVIGCLDNLQARLALNRQCHRAGKTWIDGGIGELEGQVSVYQPGKNCYECNLTDEEKCDLNRAMPCAGMVTLNAAAGQTPTTSVSASIIGAIQVQEAMKHINRDVYATTGKTDKAQTMTNSAFTTLVGKLFFYEGMHPSAGIYDFATFDKDCTAHEYWNPVVEMPKLSADTTISEAFALLKQALSVDTVEINLRNDKFVDRIVSRESNQRFFPMLPASKIPLYIKANEELFYLNATEGFYQHDFENIDESFPYQQFTLRNIGIPYLDIIQVSTPHGLFYAEFSQDIYNFINYFYLCHPKNENTQI